MRIAENDGIVFLDEIDKIAARDGGMGAGVSRERRAARSVAAGRRHHVSPRNTGPIKTDHILFIASGAFHVSKTVRPVARTCRGGCRSVSSCGR